LILDVAEMLDNAVVVSVTVMTVVTVIIDIQGLEVQPAMLDFRVLISFFLSLNGRDLGRPFYIKI
jgi:hypothetical protein